MSWLSLLPCVVCLLATSCVGVPPSTSDVYVEPTYSIDGTIQHVFISFTGINDSTSNISYTVIFSGRLSSYNFTTVTCNTTNYCTLRVTGSQLSLTDTYTVSVVTSDPSGDGTPAVFPSTVPTNIVSENIVRVVVNVTAAVVSCHLLRSYADTANTVCTISYGVSPACTMFTDSSAHTTGRSGDTLTVSLSQPVENKTEYCYTVTVLHSSLLLNIRGTFRSECDPRLIGGQANSTGMIAITNGIIFYNGVSPGSVVTLACAKRYAPSADSVNRVCMSDGNWSNENQTCVRSSGSNVQVPYWLIGVLLTLFIIAPTGWYYGSCRHRKKLSQPHTTLKDEPTNQESEGNEDEVKFEMKETQWSSV